MSRSCCSVAPTGRDDSRCPASGLEGKPVGWTTVAALTRGEVPPRQKFRLCDDADCEVVYYGSAGTVLVTDDLNVQPGFKAGSTGLVCYCFLHRRADIAVQLRDNGATGILDSIKQQVAAGNCACEVRNPSGRCCLGEVSQTVRGLRREMGVTA